MKRKVAVAVIAIVLDEERGEIAYVIPSPDEPGEVSALVYDLGTEPPGMYIGRIVEVEISESE